MSKKASRSDVAIFCAIIGGFALLVVLTLVFDVPGRAMGIVLMALGIAAIVIARPVTVARQTIDKRIPLWSGRNTLHPFTVRLWGFGLVVIGLLQILGF